MAFGARGRRGGVLGLRALPLPLMLRAAGKLGRPRVARVGQPLLPLYRVRLRRRERRPSTQTRAKICPVSSKSRCLHAHSFQTLRGGRQVTMI